MQPHAWTETTLPVTGSATLVRRLDDGTEEPVATVSATGAIIVSGLDLRGAELYLVFDNGSASLSWPGEGEFEVRSFRAEGLGEDGLTLEYHEY